MGDSDLAIVGPSDLDSYYRSIEHPFWVAWRAISHQEDPTGLFLVGFLVCLVPVFPFLLSMFLGVVFGRPAIHVWGLHFTPSSFWLWWPALATASFLVLLLIGKSEGRLIEYKSRQLSPQQMRFAYCYGTLDEIRRYRSSGEPQHIKTADGYLSMLVAAMMRASTLDLAEGAYPYHYWQSDSWAGQQKSGEHPSVGIRLKLPSWYRLHPDSEEIVKAFPRLTRLREQIADGKELDQAESALVDLAMFLYTEIANVPGLAAGAVLEKVGADSLLSFARKVNALPKYVPQPRLPRPRVRLPEVTGFKQWLMAGLTSENALRVFLTWYFFTLGVEAAICLVAFKLFSRLSMDTTVLTALISTPLVAGITMVSKRSLNARE